MKYNKVITGRFHDRVNRFIAHVYVEDILETVHVKNTGRLKELLLPGTEVILERSDNENRKTRYDLIAVYKEGLGLVNIDSQAPNKVVKEWLLTKDYTLVKPEYTFGDSRLDFYMEWPTTCLILRTSRLLSSLLRRTASSMSAPGRWTKRMSS